MSLLVKLTAATLVIPVAAAVALGALSFTATTSWEATRMAMWSGVCGFLALGGIGLAYSFHWADQSEVREADRGLQIHNMQQRIDHLSRELAIHTAAEALHQAAGMAHSCGVTPIDRKKLRGSTAGGVRKEPARWADRR